MKLMGHQPVSTSDFLYFLENQHMALLDLRMERVFAEYRVWCERYDRSEPAGIDPIKCFSNDGFSPFYGAPPSGGSAVKSAMQIHAELRP